MRKGNKEIKSKIKTCTRAVKADKNCRPVLHESNVTIPVRIEDFHVSENAIYVSVVVHCFYPPIGCLAQYN